MMRPAREVRRRPSARRVAVEEKTSAAAAPRWPRSHASSGTRRRRSNSQGCAKENPQVEFGKSKLGRLKHASLHKTIGFVEQEAAVFPRRVVARKLNQVASIQKIRQQRLFIAAERSRREHVEKLDRSLACNRQLILLGHVATENVRDLDAELIGSELVDLGFYSGQKVERTLTRSRPNHRTSSPPFKQPNR